MQEITVAQSFGDQLGKLASQAIVCDSHGRALGIFSPLPAHPPVKDLRLEPPLSIAETENLRSVKTGKPLDEILNRLGIQ